MKRKFGRFDRIVLALFVAGATLWAGTKPTWTFTFDEYLRDDGSHVTNDTVVVRWTYRDCLPTDAVLMMCRASADDPWTPVAGVSWTVGDLGGEVSVEGATNRQYFVYTDHVPVQPVHTNGVYVAGGWHSPTNAIYVPVLTGAREDGREIAPIREQED